MQIPPEITTAPDPQAAFDAHRRFLAEHHRVSEEEVRRLLTDDMLEEALSKRHTLDRLWPECPAGYVYACWNRPASEYYLRLPEGATTRDQQADWGALIPWTYRRQP